MSTIDEANVNAAGDGNNNGSEEPNQDMSTSNGKSSDLLINIKSHEPEIDNASGDKISKPYENKEFINKVSDGTCLDTSKVTFDETKKSKTQDDIISNLELELKRRTIERDCYRIKLEDTEKKFNGLKGSFDMIVNAEGDEKVLRRSILDMKTKLDRATVQLEDRNRAFANQENQINALNSQVTSLKEVVAITKDLLNIRNMEVKHLQQEVDSMESRITEERQRHNTMFKKMDDAVRLNADLKKEYETQLSLFQNLRGKYEEKVNLLSEEKCIMESKTQTSNSLS